jgi:hypothetical protein
MIKNVSVFGINGAGFLRLFSVISLVTIFLMSFSIDAAAQKTNFSGTWAFNESKSIFSQQGQGYGGARFAAKQLTVKQEGNNLTVDRLRTTQDGEDRTTTEKYTLDGKECINSNPRGGESKSVATWSADGKILSIVTKRTREGQEFKSTDVWKLSDPKILSIESTMPGRDGGERKNTLAYDKK